MIAIVVLIVLLILLVALIYFSKSYDRRVSLHGGTPTSMKRYSQLIDNVSNADTIVAPRLKKKPIDDIVWHSLAEAILVADEKHMNLHEIDVSRASSGNYNQVYTAMLDDTPVVVRIAKSSTYEGDHRRTLRNLTTATSVLDETLMARPYISSADEEHVYDSDRLELKWSVLPQLTPYSVDHLDSYVKMLTLALPLLHSVNLCYFDWKRDNVMMHDRDVVISDIDFINVNDLKNGVVHLKCSQTVSQRTLQALTTIDDYIRLDNQLAIRDIIINLLCRDDPSLSYTELCTMHASLKKDKTLDDSYLSLTEMTAKSLEVQKLLNAYYLDYENLDDETAVSILKRISSLLRTNIFETYADEHELDEIETEKPVEIGFQLKLPTFKRR